MRTLSPLDHSLFARSLTRQCTFVGRRIGGKYGHCQKDDVKIPNCTFQQAHIFPGGATNLEIVGCTLFGYQGLEQGFTSHALYQKSENSIVPLSASHGAVDLTDALLGRSCRLEW